MIYYYIEGCAALKTGKKVIPRDLFKDLEVELSLSNFCFLYVRGAKAKLFEGLGVSCSQYCMKMARCFLDSTIEEWGAGWTHPFMTGWIEEGSHFWVFMENWDARTTQSTGDMAGDYGKTQLYSHTIVPAHEAGIDAHTQLLFLLPDWLSLSLYWRKYHKGVKKKVTLKLRWSWW